MNNRLIKIALTLALSGSIANPPAIADWELVDTDGHSVTIKAGHASLQKWLLPEAPPAPADNLTTTERVKLGEMLFFDPRLSGTGQVTCVSCHLPERGWSDGLPTSVRFLGEVMTVASPTIVNLGYNSIFMWDGRQPNLEKQGLGGQGIKADINAGMAHFGLKEGVHLERLAKVPGYVELFEQAYPGKGISRETVAKAIAAFERSIISNNSPFDRWLKGDAAALSTSQVRGFALFIDPLRGNCSVCHWAPNFTDNGFHNVGLKSFGVDKPDLGRYKQRPVKLMRGAFKTPTLRDVALTAPYFHDGSATRLGDVVRHYARGGDVHTNLSPNLRPLALADEDIADLVAFMEALTTPQPPYVYPVLPK
jgi:cytochrome c peroxidase